MLKLLAEGLETVQPQIIKHISLQETSTDTFAVIVEVKKFSHVLMRGWYGIEILGHLSFYPQLVNQYGTNVHVFANLGRSLLLMNRTYNHSEATRFNKILDRYKPELRKHRTKMGLLSDVILNDRSWRE